MEKTSDRKFKLFILLSLCLFLLPSATSGSEILGFKAGRSEILLEMIGLNYLPLSWNIPLTRSPIPVLSPAYEREIYGHLLSHIPRFLILEASTYPLPLLGVALRYWTPDFYQAMELWTNFNLVESVTVSFFEEPWAVTLFFGNVVKFDRIDSRRAGGMGLKDDNGSTNDSELKGRGYSGLLITYGNRQIKHNLLIPNDWLETELKLIGSFASDLTEISWSYRLGARWNFNPEIDSLLYLSLKRDRLDRDFRAFSLVKNSMIEFELAHNLESGRFHKITLVLGKKFPMKKSRLIPELNLGFTWKFNPLYRGSLLDGGDTGFSLVVSPNIRF